MTSHNILRITDDTTNQIQKYYFNSGGILFNNFTYNNLGCLFVFLLDKNIFNKFMSNSIYS